MFSFEVLLRSAVYKKCPLGCALYFFDFWRLLWEGVSTLPPKDLTFPGPMRSYTVKENHIGSAVSEILRYRQKKLANLWNRINTIIIFNPLMKLIYLLISNLKVNLLFTCIDRKYNKVCIHINGFQYYWHFNSFLKLSNITFNF